MAVTNTWAVVQMDAYPEYDGDTDVVFNVHWTLTGVARAPRTAAAGRVLLARPRVDPRHRGAVYYGGPTVGSQIDGAGSHDRAPTASLCAHGELVYPRRPGNT